MKWFIYILPLVVALSSCTSTQDAISDYRESHEVVVAVEFRNGLGWLGIGVRNNGKAAEIATKEAYVVPLSGK